MRRAKARVERLPPGNWPSDLQGQMSRYPRSWHGMMMSAGDDRAATKSIEESGSGERRTMHATSRRCVFCSAEYPLTHRGPCSSCARPGEESALHETLAVQYDVAALKHRLDREELARRPVGL